MIAMIAHAKLTLDQSGDAFCRPQCRGISMRLRPGFQKSTQMLKLHGVKPGLASGGHSRQALLTLRFDDLNPLMY
jgi:hypothetical protein